MSKKTRITAALSAAATLGAATALAVLVPAPAFAHVTVTPDAAPAGSYAVLEFSVGHGCDGSPTRAVTFTLPEGVESVTPTVNAGWVVTEGKRTVTYTARTPLPDGLRDTFELSVRMPEREGGEPLAFTVLQECEQGQIEWSELAQGAGEPEHPAPIVVVTEPVGDAHGEAPAGDRARDAAARESDAGAEGPDVTARVLGVAGLVLGAVGITVALRRRGASA